MFETNLEMQMTRMQLPMLASRAGYSQYTVSLTTKLLSLILNKCFSLVIFLVLP